MPYPALPDRRMPWDDDGTIFVTSAAGQPYTSGATTYPSGAQAIALNGQAALTPSTYAPCNPYNLDQYFAGWWFFPEQREVTGCAFVNIDPDNDPPTGVVFEGSNDTTNGLDGSWETASVTGSLIISAFPQRVDAWRAEIASISFTGPKQVVRLRAQAPGGGDHLELSLLHIYGQKAAGQTPDDILYLDGDNAYAEFTEPEDFGDVPLGTTTVRTFKIKNSSATKTATTIDLQCNDQDFTISTDNATWVVTINIVSLAAGASSGVMYIRNTTPPPGSPLGPRFARIVCTVGSWV